MPTNEGDSVVKTAVKSQDGKGEKKASAPRREIPGNLPYITSPGTLRNILKKVIDLARPDKFNYDFLENVVKITGGNARACIPILKKMGFVNSDNSTTDLYGKFRTEGGRSYAAYEGMRRAFPEIFKRSDYAYSIEDSKVKDIIVEITGLKSNDSVAVAIKGTFNVIKEFIAPGFNHTEQGAHDSLEETEAADAVSSTAAGSGSVGLNYHINIVIPETSDVKVLNAIFRAVRENLL